MLLTYGILGFCNYAITKINAWHKALELTGAQGIVNLGCGDAGNLFAAEIACHPSVAANIDVIPQPWPNFIQADLNQPLPFGDQEFSVAFMSHVLEHLEDWKFALSEAQRVAEYSVIVLPHYLSIGNYLVSDHKRIFGPNSVERFQALPGVFLYI